MGFILNQHSHHWGVPSCTLHNWSKPGMLRAVAAHRRRALGPRCARTRNAATSDVGTKDALKNNGVPMCPIYGGLTLCWYLKNKYLSSQKAVASPLYLTDPPHLEGPLRTAPKIERSLPCVLLSCWCEGPKPCKTAGIIDVTPPS